jgi:hypothetical protein
MKLKLGIERAKVCVKQPGTPSTDITHQSVFNITPSVKIEHDIMSDMGARNAGVCFSYENYTDITKSL